MTARPRDHTDLVIGAGPAGLAVAAMLSRRGRRPLVLERDRQVGASWLSRYECLRLNTVRWLSGLPGFSIPRSFGGWVRASDYARYLESYARHHRLEIRFDSPVERIERRQGEWAVITPAGALTAASVVVATGYDRSPHVPDWAGREDFSVPLLHASAYRNAARFRGQDVLIVGGGNSAADIAVDLARGGASRVRLAPRTPPQIVPRTVLGIPVQVVAVATRRLPPVTGDAIVRFLRKRSFGDLSAYGLPLPREALSSQFRRSDVVPIVDVEFVDAVKRGAVEVVGAVERVHGRQVFLRDGRVLAPDALIAATGYCRGLEGLVGHLGVLDPDGRPLGHGPVSPPGAAGLYFIGYTNPLSGNLRELGIDARRLATAIGARGPGLSTGLDLASADECQASMRRRRRRRESSAAR